MSAARDHNQAFYDEFWQSCPDFSRYNPGARHRRRLLGQAIKSAPFRSLLDVGCGDGQFLLWVRSQVGSSVSLAGADLSPDTVRANRDRMSFASFWVLDLEKEPLNEVFDMVICSEVVEHLAKQDRAVANLAKMVAPGGMLLVTCPAGRIYETERQFGHVRHPQPEDLLRYATQAGLEVVYLKNWGFPLYGVMKWVTNVRPQWALRNFASARYSTAAKLVSSALYWAHHINLPDSPRGCQLVMLARRTHVNPVRGPASVST